ncbi:general transcription factor IIF subunit 1-like [Macrobrachium nipponense]|uniref:general transcription factor IIF subunit 1-like n=1 Tax=Macrobrachium nipponense TaxID=159736 RepID=UPI0030C89DFC
MERKEKGSIQEYVVKAPKTTKKKFNMMRFHSALGIEFKTWTHAKMERENNMKEFRSMEDEMPKYGAGSEFGREQKEEARRKKFGIHMKKYRPEDQPWILTIGGKGGKKFKGIREGGVSENSSWYVFMQGKDGAFEAYPVEEWYNYKLIQRYKSLTAEEAEQHFEKRNKIMNYFTVMKKDKNAPQDGDEDSGKPKKKGSHDRQLILSEMDDWISDDESGDDEREEEEDSEDDKKKKKKYKVQSKGRKPQGGKKSKTMDGDSDEDCIEESDEFDDGAEHDYISSDSSDSDAEDDEIVRKELAGVDEADALRKLLNSDEEEEEEEKEKEEEGKEEKNENEEKEPKDKKKKKKKKKDRKSDKEDSDGKTSDASDDEGDSKKKKKKDSKANGVGESDAQEGGSSKRKMKDGPDSEAKKMRTDVVGSQMSTPGSDSGVTEEAIRRYLMRKPMTTTELLQKFKLKKTGLNSDQLVHSIAQILKRVNPVKQMVKGKMYLSIKM